MRKFVLRGLVSLLAMLIVFGNFNGGLFRPDKALAAVPFQGAGKIDSPYLVGTAELFNEIRNYPTTKYYFKLTDDIDLSGYSAGTGWDPIGNTGRPFYGHVDGNGYKITGLTINNPTANYMGLFGYLGSNYSIANLTLENVSVTGQQYVGGLAGYIVSGTIDNNKVSGQVTGDTDAGGLVGASYGGKINGSHSSVNVSGTSAVGGLLGTMEMGGSSISNSYATGVVRGANSGENMGGLAGYVGSGTISNCYAAGNVFGGASAGGLVGSDTATSVSTSYASGDVSGTSNVGGLIGYTASTSTLSDSYASGAVIGTSSIGGLIGYKNYNLTIKNSYASGLVNGGISSSGVGGLVGDADPDVGGMYAPILNSFYDVNATGQSISAGGSGITTSQMNVQGTFAADTSNAWDFTTIWAIHSQRNGGYPYLLTTQAYLDYSGNNGVNGAVPPSRSYVPGESVAIYPGSMVLNQNLIDGGYVFYGWNTATNGSGVTYKPGDSITMTSDLTLYAYWMIPSSSATLSSTIGTVSAGGTAEESVKDIPYGTTLAAFKAAITPAEQAAFEIYESNGTTVASQLVTGNIIIVTAQDGVTKVTYYLTVYPNSAKDITAFSLAAQTGAATINAASHTVAVQVAYGTDRSSLAASFILSADASAKVGNVNQISGSTVNDYSTPVTYVIEAGDGSTQNWIVTVTVALNGAKDIMAFSMATQTGAATISASAHTVSVKVAYGTGLNGLVASFMLSPGATAKIGSTIQVSGTTANNFTSAVTYVVTAENGSAQNWKITVTVAAASSAKDIVSFSLAEQTGPATIDTSAHTVTIEVAAGTDASNLVATFALSTGASAKVGIVDQVSGTTGNDFANPLEYTVRAEDGSTQIWTVTVSVAKSNVATLTSTIGTVSSKGTVNETITNIPYGTTLAAFKAAITPAPHATFNVYDSDGMHLATVLETGKEVIVKAEDGITKVTYTVTVNAAPGGSGSTFPSTPPSDEGPAGNPSDHGSAEEPSSNPQPTIVFSDINGHWAEKAIQQALQSGIIAGYPDGTFKPNHVVTRAEFVVMLMKALKPETAGEQLSFTDADKIGTWARGAVAQAVQEGIIKGYGDGSFRPNAEVTRAEMVAMIANALKLPIGSGATGFSDDKDFPEWVRGSIVAIKNLGIIQGTGNNRFHPNGNATRAEAVTVLIKMLAWRDQ